jgi:hypothetical protein
MFLHEPIGKDLIFVCICLERIYSYLKKISSESMVIGYINLKILNFFCQSNMSSAAFHLYEKINDCLAGNNLISKFKFHYTIKFNNYCNCPLGHEDIYTQMLEYS